MGLRDQISKWLGRGKAAEQTTSDEATPSSSRTSPLYVLFEAERDRQGIVQYSREMYKVDPRIRRVMRTLAHDMIHGGCTIKVKNNARAQQVAADLITRLKLETRMSDWVRLTLRDGDSFLEAGVNAAREIAVVTRKPTLEMHRNSDEADRFADSTKAFWYSSESYWGLEAPQDATWFAQWQIIHARWDHDEGSRYGMPLFGSATSTFKRVTEGETDVAVRRKTRAGMKYFHLVDGDASDVEAYKEQNKDTLDNPFAAAQDFFSNKPGGISAIGGDATLGDITDIMHHVRTLFVATPLPMSLIGYGQDLNRDVLDKQELQYKRELDPLTKWVEDEMVRPLVELQWLLAGILPEGLDYSIEWMNKDPVTAADIRDAADAALRLRAIGLDDATIMKLLQQFLPGIDVSTIELSPPPSDNLGQVAAGVDGL